jgi:hypothetical protein
LPSADCFVMICGVLNRLRTELLFLLEIPESLARSLYYILGDQSTNFTLIHLSPLLRVPSGARIAAGNGPVPSGTDASSLFRK